MRTGAFTALVAAGDIVVETAAMYSLADVPIALDRVAQKHVRGTVVIEVDGWRSGLIIASAQPPRSVS